MREHTDRPYVIYSRKSRFTGKGESIENQIGLCRRYIADHWGEGAAAAALVYEDEGFSGGSLDRPQFRRMMRQCRSAGFAAVVVYRLDRISRNIGDFAKLIEELGQLDIGFISIREQFDTSSPMGRAMMYIASVFSQLERETIAERIRDNLRELAKTGRWLGGVTPVGYVSQSVGTPSADGKLRRASRLQPVPGELELVEGIFRAFLACGSLNAVVDHLRREGRTTRQGKEFSRFAVRAILTNPVYLMADRAAYTYLTGHHVELFAGEEEFDGRRGIMAYNRTLQRAGKTNQLRPMEEWIVSVGEHPGIIPGAQWVQVQTMLEPHPSHKARHPRGRQALLAGLLRCGCCGGTMRPKLTGRENGAGEETYIYLCTTKEHSRKACCTVKNAPGNALDAAVLEQIKALAEDTALCAKLLAGAGKAGRREDELSVLRGRAEDGQRRLRGLVDALPRAAGTAAEGYLLEEIERAHRGLEQLQAQLARAQEQAALHRLDGEELEVCKEHMASLAACVDLCTVEEKRRLVRAVVHQAVWDGEGVTVYLGAEDGPGVPACEDSK